MIVWTIPPGPVELHDALERVSPAIVVLFALDPGLDEPGSFLRRLGGLVKYALRARGGQVSLPSLAAQMAHSETTIRQGLAWMEQKGQVEIVRQGREQVALRAGRGMVGEGLSLAQGHLQARLAETAAYRAYFGSAGAHRLVVL